MKKNLDFNPRDYREVVLYLTCVEGYNIPEAMDIALEHSNENYLNAKGLVLLYEDLDVDPTKAIVFIKTLRYLYGLK